MNRREIIQTVDLLNVARDAYYNTGQTIMTDKEYDDRLAELANAQKELNFYPTNSPVGKVGAEVNETGLKKVKHEIRARSLDKTKDVSEVIKKMDNKSDCEVVTMWKLDGCTVVLTYLNGDLVLAATRGDGEIGLDITANTKYIEGIPQHIENCEGKLIVRGECIITYSDFRRINESLPEGVAQYANPRNLASASVSMLDPEDMRYRGLKFKAFDVAEMSQLPNGTLHFLNFQFNYLKSCGFGVVPYTLCEVYNIRQTIEQYTECAANFDIPVDGIVFALNDRRLSKDLPGTEHHPDPKYGYAFKWADEEAETILRNIEWSPSRTGLLNPVAVFDPVELCGTTVSRASLHNVTQMYRILGPHPFVGEKILVMKSNMIIPIVTKGFWEDVYSSRT